MKIQTLYLLHILNIDADERDRLIDYLEAWPPAMYYFRRFLEGLEGVELW